MEHESFENDGGRRRAQRAFRLDQGRSRGAAGRRSRLHDVRAGDDRIRRLADERVADAGAEAVLRRHLLSAVVEVGPARLRRHPAGDRARLEGGARQGRRVGGGADRRGCTSMEQAAPAGPCPAADALDADREAVSRGVRSAPRRLRRRAEVSAAVASCCSCCASTRAPAHAPARDMVLRTLRAMALGGMRDHIGGGFHRYSVDAGWRVPHFEKMLYDQAQLVLAFLEGAQVSGDPFYAEVAEDTLLYVMREMTDAGRRVLFGRGRRQRSAGGRRRAARAQEGRRVLSLARRRARRAARRRRASRQAAVRRRAGRQRAAGSAAGVHRQEPALRRAIDRRGRAADRDSRPTRSSRS